MMDDFLKIKDRALLESMIVQDCVCDLLVDKYSNGNYLGSMGRERRKNKIKEILENIL